MGTGKRVNMIKYMSKYMHYSCCYQAKYGGSPYFTELRAEYSLGKQD